MSDLSVVVARTVGELVVAHPNSARVFDAHQIDYCCGGRRTLAEACEAAGAPLAEICIEIASDPSEQPADWSGLGPVELADHIVSTHHRYLRRELPELDGLAAKVEAAHETRHPQLAEVRRLVHEVRLDLEPHMAKEERVLFPAIAALVAGERDFAFGSIKNPIGVMIREHDRVGELLSDLRAAARDYQVPEDACTSFRSLYARLGQLEVDTHEHIHKENNVLFPALLALLEPAPDRVPLP